MTIQSLSSIRCRCRCMSLHPTFDSISFESRYPLLPAISPPTRRALSLSAVIFTAISTLASSSSLAAPSKSAAPQFFELPDSAGVKALELRIGSGETPVDGDQVAVHYYGRLAAKQGWRFDTTYDHKDENGEPIPFTFVLGSGKVIAGMEAAVKSMKVGGIRRVIIPPSQGYQNTSQEPIPPNYFDRQRLFTTIFNPTRLANGEGSSLGILIFDIELVQVRHLSNKFASPGS
ncbi:peptidyl-prolyl cis-trans isomerase FKBP17-1, chloroplastic [Cucurbita pepo subsp. pepo]|uniref:peptidyl-prolyl cis-trans isomerase FKBP17-1, chloroplastic n=1 Tax=Cucurbita pepo subsp. pepo TaxID=3664 RepID=UPI000C9D74DA|nr:peptidyl-prolyl cis-trans isomerase FKBP17-1, chloroplastic [Cucurbita pepo subsp. pepo]